MQELVTCQEIKYNLTRPLLHLENKKTLPIVEKEYDAIAMNSLHLFIKPSLKHVDNFKYLLKSQVENLLHMSSFI